MAPPLILAHQFASGSGGDHVSHKCTYMLPARVNKLEEAGFREMDSCWLLGTYIC